LADVDVVNVVADLDDLAGHVATGNVRQRNGVVRKAVANPQVEMIEGASADADEDFMGMDVRFVHIGVMQHTRVPMFVKEDGFHPRAPEAGRPWTEITGRNIVIRYVGGAGQLLLIRPYARAGRMSRRPRIDSRPDRT
jgi:hypothetical protein